MHVIDMTKSEPWRYEHGFVKGSNGYTVAQVYTTLEDDGSLMQRHGLRIAAAPELLAACEAVAAYIADGNPQFEWEPQLRAAISKARGESE